VLTIAYRREGYLEQTTSTIDNFREIICRIHVDFGLGALLAAAPWSNIVGVSRTIATVRRAHMRRPSAERTMKVLLVDDHVMFREGLSLLLRSLMEGVEILEAGSSSEAMSQLAVHEGIGLVLMDIGLPDLSGIEAIRLLREKYPEVPVVALSSSEDKATVLSAIDHGAMGFVPKSASSSILTGALRLILAKGIYLPPSAFIGDRHALGAIAGPALAPAGNQDSAKMKSPTDLGLTPRQSDVLFRVLQGKSAKVISRELNLSASTVKSHTSAVLRALNVTTRTQAIVAAGKIGLRF
jgi:DNA-binding NarL/FixJ family response regulator